MTSSKSDSPTLTFSQAQGYEEVPRPDLRNRVATLPLNQVFDLVQFLMRHPHCPADFVSELSAIFAVCQLAYVIDAGPPATIVPAATREEGDAIVDSLNALRSDGLTASASHLRSASECINVGDWAGSVRESIHAVESVARKIAPGAVPTH